MTNPLVGLSEHNEEEFEQACDIVDKVLEQIPEIVETTPHMTLTSRHLVATLMSRVLVRSLVGMLEGEKPNSLASQHAQLTIAMAFGAYAQKNGWFDQDEPVQEGQTP